MPQFGDYAHYYNLFYEQKDYAGESDFVLRILEKYGQKPAELLDLGCGTARHALVLAREGMAVTGVDLSQTMLDMASMRITGKNCPTLVLGDARSIRLHKKFDAVISLFHVLSYQTTANDCVAQFRTAHDHLKRGCLFLADFWYGPGVLKLRPGKRELTLEKDGVEITRKAEPHLDVSQDTVLVHYDVTLQNRATGKSMEFSEDHLMRYWFLPELRYLASQAGLEFVAEGAWLSETEPGEDDWSAWLLLRKGD